jgi:phenylacetate-CoA ligase
MRTRQVTGALFRSAIPGLAFPAVPSRAGAELLSLLFQLEQTQYFPETLLRARQLRQLAELVNHAARSSAFFQERLGAAGVVDSLDWERFETLPLLTRRDLLTQADRIHARNLPSAHGAWHEVQTSGSTGQVVAVRRTGLTDLFWLALSMRDHHWHARDFRKTLVVIRANAASSEGQAARDWGPPVSLLHESGPCHVMPLSTDVTVLSRWLLEKDPSYLLTYPTCLAGLLDCFERDRQRPSKLEEVRTIGETLKPELRTRARAVLGARVCDAYSAQEVGSIALQCPESGLYHVQSESLLVEVLDAQGRACAPGEVGRVVVTDLHNFATPLIRYELRDYAEVGPACPCGRGLPTLSRVLGRERNMVHLPDGSRHWPLVGLHHFREVAEILQYQLVQHSLTEVEMRLVTRAPLAPAAEQKLREIVQHALGHAFPLRFSYSEQELANSAGGKFEEFVSLLTANG